MFWLYLDQYNRYESEIRTEVRYRTSDNVRKIIFGVRKFLAAKNSMKFFFYFSKNWKSLISKLVKKPPERGSDGHVCLPKSPPTAVKTLIKKMGLEKKCKKNFSSRQYWPIRHHTGHPQGNTQPTQLPNNAAHVAHNMHKKRWSKALSS